jgi:outer membrane protein assembly factor BamB
MNLLSNNLRTLPIIRKMAPFAIVATLFTSLAQGEDWPQWRGPKRDGISTETGLLKEWPADGPKLLWQVKAIGEGYSTPAVVGNRLYLVGNRGMDDEFVQALDSKDGHQIWETHIGKVGVNRGPQYPGARSTPTVDGALLYALGSDGDLACLETDSGKLKWHKNLRTDFGGEPGAWAYSESPLVDGDLLICTPGGADATIVALDKKSGDTVWKSPLEEADQAGYASAIVFETGGVKQYVQFVQKGLVGVDAKTGKLLWRYDRTAKGSQANIPTPVAHDNFIYSATGRVGGGLVALKTDKAGVTAEQVYFEPKMPSAIGGAVEHDGYLYGTNGQGMLCADFATGEHKWQDRGVGPGGVLYAEGLIYVHGENGDVAIFAAKPDGFSEKGRFTPPELPDRGSSKAWAYPVIADGKLYIHDWGTLWCYDVKDRATK